MSPTDSRTGFDVETSVPITYNRAKTAIIQCHSHLLKARLAVRTAMLILERLDDPKAPWPQDAGERRELLESYQDFVARLEVAERSLIWAWKQHRGGSPWEPQRRWKEAERRGEAHGTATSALPDNVNRDANIADSQGVRGTE
jgi:hypothetical protein